MVCSLSSYQGSHHPHWSSRARLHFFRQHQILWDLLTVPGEWVGVIFQSLLSFSGESGLSMAMIRKTFKLVLISISRSFWILQHRQNVFLQKTIAIICPDTRASYQRGCLRTKEWITTETHTVQKHLTKLRHWQQGPKGIKCAAQNTSQQPSGLLRIPQAGICQHPCTPEADLSTKVKAISPRLG